MSRTSIFSQTFLLILLLLSLRTKAILNPIDFLALQSLAKSLSDLSGSHFLSTWDFTLDPCSFPGILCFSDRVVSLSLGDPRANSPGLSGHLPTSLQSLESLRSLSVIPGKISGPLPPLPQRLRLLAIAGNQFSGSIPHSLAALTRLRTLDLSNNQFSGPIPSQLLRIPSLETVILSHNRLSGAIPSPVSAPLRRLDLKANSLSGNVPILPASIIYLSLASNGLTGRVNRVLPHLKSLNYLDISSNKLSGPVPGEIFTFPIHSIQLQRNRFEGILKPAGQLAVEGARVDLSYNRLTGSVPGELAPAGRLYLDFNRFVGDVAESVVERVMSGRMRVLYLQHNFLTGFHVRPAAVVPSGTVLCLQYNCLVSPVNNACPRSAGPQRTRPPEQCAAVWRKKRRVSLE